MREKFESLKNQKSLKNRFNGYIKIFTTNIHLFTSNNTVTTRVQKLKLKEMKMVN